MIATNNLSTEFRSLSADRKRSVHLALCKFALGKWSAFFDTANTIQYVDTVVGLRHTLDKDLLTDALHSASKGRDLSSVEERFREPVTALQDDDLSLPEPVEFAFYSIYNLFKKYALKQSIDDWLIVNQALASEENSSLWKKLLAGSITKST